MSTIRITLVAALALCLSAPALQAAPPASDQPEASPDVLLETIRSNRKALVAVNLRLSDEESAKFWPLYDRYQTEMNGFGDRLVRLLEDYDANFATLSNEKALTLITEYLEIEAERVKVRRTYLDEFAKILPGRTVARLYQIENKMDAVIRYDLAATIPVVEEEPGTPPAK